MVRSVLAVALALLMLLPPGICICGGGPRPCPDHRGGGPGSEPTDCPAASGTVGCCGGIHASRTEHRCPDPIPHDSSCPAVSQGTAQVAAENTPETTLLDLGGTSVAVPVPPLTVQRPAPTLRVAVATPPLFLVHCALLI